MDFDGQRGSSCVDSAERLIKSVEELPLSWCQSAGEERGALKNEPHSQSQGGVGGGTLLSSWFYPEMPLQLLSACFT